MHRRQHQLPSVPLEPRGLLEEYPVKSDLAGIGGGSLLRFALVEDSLSRYEYHDTFVV
jgi:hypothetical protein